MIIYMNTQTLNTQIDNNKPKTAYTPGTILELRKPAATRITGRVSYKPAHRNFEVVETLYESSGGLMAMVKMSAKFSAHCYCCGRALTLPISKASGIGPDCAAKLGIERLDSLSAEQIIEKIEANLPKEVVKVFIDKKQIKNAIIAE